MNFGPGVVPQWPRSLGLMCSLARVFPSGGFVIGIDLAHRGVVVGRQYASIDARSRFAFLSRFERKTPSSRGALSDSLSF
jgi:hypothetical protein